MTMETNRDIYKKYSIKESVSKLRRLADCLEAGTPFKIDIAGERIKIPVKALFTIDHERNGDSEKVSFQFKWETKIANFDASLDVNDKSISIDSKRKYLGKYRKFRNVQKICKFVKESFYDGASWTNETNTPHFRYNDITYYLNGDSVGDGDRANDAIALPWFELKNRGMTEEAIKDVIEREGLEIADPKPKSSKKIGPGQDRGGYICIEISRWKDMKTIFDFMND